MEPLAVAVIEPQTLANFANAGSDEHVIAWRLHDKAGHSELAYRADVRRFVAHADKPLSSVTLSDKQGFADSADLFSAASAYGWYGGALCLQKI